MISNAFPVNLAKFLATSIMEQLKHIAFFIKLFNLYIRLKGALKSALQNITVMIE